MRNEGAAVRALAAGALARLPRALAQPAIGEACARELERERDADARDAPALGAARGMSATLAEVLIEADGSRTGQVRVKSRSANWHRRQICKN